MKELRTVRNFVLEVYSDENGKLRYSGIALNTDTGKRVTFCYMAKRDDCYNIMKRGESYEALRDRIYTCDCHIQGNTVYLTR